MKITARWAALAIALLSCTTLQAKLPGGISGTWYNPQQSGHGLSVNLVDSARAVVIWHVYDPDGEPLTLYIDGDVQGRRIDGRAYAPRGMAFGSFDPAALELPEWGEVDIEFTNCVDAKLSWNSTDPAYASGEMDITRLAFVDGVDCDLPPPNALPAGLYSADFASTAYRIGGRGLGIVDHEGRLWGVQRWQPDGMPNPVPGNWNYPPRGQVVMARPLAVNGDRIDVQVVSMENLWTSRTARSVTSTGHWLLDGSVVGRFDADDILFAGSQDWFPAAPNEVQLLAPVSLSQLAGAYTITLRDQFFERNASLEVGTDGHACIDLNGHDLIDTCELRGVLSTSEGEAGLIDFEFRDTRNAALAPYRGRGFLVEVGKDEELILIGSNGSIGFGVFAR